MNFMNYKFYFRLPITYYFITSWLLLLLLLLLVLIFKGGSICVFPAVFLRRPEKFVSFLRDIFDRIYI